MAWIVRGLICYFYEMGARCEPLNLHRRHHHHCSYLPSRIVATVVVSPFPLRVTVIPFTLTLGPILDQGVTVLFELKRYHWHAPPRETSTRSALQRLGHTVALDICKFFQNPINSIHINIQFSICLISALLFRVNHERMDGTYFVTLLMNLESADTRVILDAARNVAHEWLQARVDHWVRLHVPLSDESHLANWTLIRSFISMAPNMRL